ncbi:MAG: hypothetical protein IJI14_20905, partial [Anaerolineaceae bacterium]|nr:hypothetical protein [Anaerolineaceae bacterium]
SGYDFAIPSSRLFLTEQTLGVAFEFVGNYASMDFHHRALTCPSYNKKCRIRHFLFYVFRTWTGRAATRTHTVTVPLCCFAAAA